MSLRKKLNVCDIIKDKVINNIIEKDLIKDGDRILVGVSGGPDSMCLLDLLNELKNYFEKEKNIRYYLSVAHVNHGIRLESEVEVSYVKNFCKKLNIPFFYLKEDIPVLAKELKQSEETTGRMVRYSFFENICKEQNFNKIATAHNMDDDIETVLLNIIRGSGLKGLCGINYKTNNIIRPLLNVSKKDILEYNVLKNLNPCFDKTNEQTIYSRNKIRNKLIPTLKNEYNSNVCENIVRMKNILVEEEDFLENYAKKIVDNMIVENVDKKLIFNFECLKHEHIAIKKRIIRSLLFKKLNTLDGIESIHISDILNLLEKNIKGKKYIIGNKFEICILKKNIAVIY